MVKDGIIGYLGRETIYTDGKLSFQGAVRIDGQFTGEIRSEGTLILGKDAQVKGDIQVNQLVLSGTIRGDVVVSGKTVMHKTADFQGNLTTKNLIMEEGALLQGSIIMRPQQAALPEQTGKRSEPPALTVVRGAQ
jgi:cytoskeletal protein CcmA (bactofilin family)